MVSITPNDSTEVVTAIDIITNPRESTVISYMYLRTTIDVGIGSTSEGIVDASVTQIDVRIAKDITFITATIDVFCLRNG